MRTSWLPPDLAAGPFAVAAARESGVPRSRLRDATLHIPTRSVRTLAPPGTPIARAAAFRVVLPEDVGFSHITACQLWRLSLPRPLDSQPQLDVMRSTGRAHIRRAGCIGHRGLECRDTARAGGLPVTGLADTWVDLGEVLDRGLALDDLVVLGDEVATRLAGTS